jgi:hypothetical protein
MPNLAASNKNVTHATAALAVDANSGSMSSPEQMYSPIRIVKSSSSPGGPMSAFSNAVGVSDSGQFELNHLGPTRAELDPYFSSFLNDPDEWMGEVDFQFMNNNGTGTDGPDTNIGKVNRSSISAVQVTHFRGPLCVSGLGTDLADRPFPSLGVAGSDSWNLNPLSVGDRSMWPAGPVDLKWDAERSVWSGGPHILCGVTESVPAGGICNPSTFSVKVIRLENGIGGSPPLSNTLFGETVTAYNFDSSLEEGSGGGGTDAEGNELPPKKIFVVVARLSYIWIPIWVGCPDCGESEDDPCPDDACVV